MNVSWFFAEIMKNTIQEHIPKYKSWWKKIFCFWVLVKYK